VVELYISEETIRRSAEEDLTSSNKNPELDIHLLRAAVLDGDESCLQRLRTLGSVGVGLRGNELENPTSAYRQVESLLKHVLDFEVERALADQENINDAIHHLNQHNRIIGRKKKKKKKKSPTPY
jgi:hypothetical protein